MTIQSPDNDVHLKQLRRLILDYVAGYPVKVYLYGSRAKDTAQHPAEIDIAILPLQPLPIGFLAQLREIVEESTIPYSIDIIDLNEADETLRKKILAEAIIWQDWSND